MARVQREDVAWWLSASIDDYEFAQLFFKGGKYSKTVHVLHNAAQKALKAAILAGGRTLLEEQEGTTWRGYPR